LARHRIVAAELAAGVVAVPDLVVGRDLHPPGPGLGARQGDFPQLHRGGIDGGDLVRAEQHHPWVMLFGTNKIRSEEHTSELQSRSDLVCRLLLEKKKYDSPIFRNL